ncbi:hypothetical protein P5673_027274 [Acropora cervicornis]|uniref:Ephrin RBD domain-containing protein n=1 Tax=Acropora cervicornis TaxID=6130 RepID=A0AAD9PZA2_ACRCE|nr:hypothetical protein P5673_027274 [Acropora cervicornis]
MSTANGSKESLDKTSGGHCEEFNMRLEIYVCQNSTVWLKIAIISLGFLLLISVFVNIFLIVKIRNRKCSTPEMRDSNKHLSNYSGST